MGFRLVYLLLTFARFLCQDQCHSQLDCKKFDKTVSFRYVKRLRCPVLIKLLDAPIVHCVCVCVYMCMAYIL